VYSQVLKGAAYTDIARELEAHAGEELGHAIRIAKQIDYFGGMPAVTPSRSKPPMIPWKCCVQIWRTNEKRWALSRAHPPGGGNGEFALSETLRAIIVQEQEHEIDLAAALDIDVPLAKEPSGGTPGENK